MAPKKNRAAASKAGQGKTTALKTATRRRAKPADNLAAASVSTPSPVHTRTTPAYDEAFPETQLDAVEVRADGANTCAEETLEQTQVVEDGAAETHPEDGGEDGAAEKALAEE